MPTLEDALELYVSHNSEGSLYCYCRGCEDVRKLMMTPKNMVVGEVRVTDPETGGQKGSKPEQLAWLPWDAIAELAKHYGYGAEKYEDPHNYKKGYKWSLSANAMLRHLTLWMQGQDNDEEAGTNHMAAVAWHALTLLHYQLSGKGTDDLGRDLYERG